MKRTHALAKLAKPSVVRHRPSSVTTKPAPKRTRKPREIVQPVATVDAFAVEIPIRTRSMSNARLHWSARARIVAQERAAVRVWWPRGVGVTLPCVVMLTRVAPRALDDDNLRGALKGIRDQVAAQLGVDDRDQRVIWTYQQAKAPQPNFYAVRINAYAKACTSCGATARAVVWTNDGDGDLRREFRCEKHLTEEK